MSKLYPQHISNNFDTMQGLSARLDGSIAIWSLWPEAFKDNSKCKHGFIVSHDNIKTYLQRSSDGARRVYNLNEVPAILTPTRAQLAKFKRNFPRAKWARDYSKLLRKD